MNGLDELIRKLAEMDAKICLLTKQVEFIKKLVIIVLGYLLLQKGIEVAMP